MGLFGTSGIRGLCDRSLIDLALRVGLVVGKVYPAVVVGSSGAMKHAVISGLLAAGARVEDARTVPTPTLGLAARQFTAGVMITASHNPPEYNGLKLLNPDGSAFDAAQQRQIETALGDPPEIAPWDELAESAGYDGAIEQHIERIRQDFPSSLKLKVMVDCGGGVASVITPRLLMGLGCKVMQINCQPTGFFPRGIEPSETNLEDLTRTTREAEADVGIAHDGDADRMMAVDERGRYISGDKLLAIFAREAGAREVVTTMDASMAIDELGFRVRRTRIGDTFVSEELKHGGDFGGEPSGSWVFPGISFCPDGIYAAARLAAIASRQKLSKLVDGLPGYPILRGSIANSGLTVSELKSRLLDLEPAAVSEVDGIKLSFDDGWLLVRVSGTEPKIRLTVEAKSRARVHQLYTRCLGLIEERLEQSKERVN
jgi:phosphoglucosamine mutase